MLRLGRLVPIALLIWLAGSCGSLTGPDDHRPTGTFRVLLIGNSLTYFNELPALLESLADSAGVEDLYVQAVAYPDYGLGDHFAQGDALREIRKGGWRFVVMQQGPSALPASREYLLEWASRFAVEIRAVGAIPAFYAVWPSADRAFDFDRVHESYALAAEAVDGALLPAGEAWRAAWRRQANLPLYGGDGFHPSVQGTYLAALVMLRRFYPGLSPVGLPAALTLGGTTIPYVIPAQSAPILQAAAVEAHTEFGR